MNPAKDNILDWLRDAHAMEQQAEKMLSTFSERLEHYPEFKNRIDSHIQVKKSQQELLKECIEHCGSSPSVIKDLGAKLLGFSQTASGIFVSDEVVKGAMSIYVFEQMEIASYTILGTAAKHIGDARVLAVCEQILPQEIAMAQWLQAYLPNVTVEFLARSMGAKEAAKR